VKLFFAPLSVHEIIWKQPGLGSEEIKKDGWKKIVCVLMAACQTRLAIV